MRFPQFFWRESSFRPTTAFEATARQNKAFDSSYIEEQMVKERLEDLKFQHMALWPRKKILKLFASTKETWAIYTVLNT